MQWLLQVVVGAADDAGLLKTTGAIVLMHSMHSMHTQRAVCSGMAGEETEEDDRKSWQDCHVDNRADEEV
jgi:hypothetical protein